MDSQSGLSDAPGDGCQQLSTALAQSKHSCSRSTSWRGWSDQKLPGQGVFTTNKLQNVCGWRHLSCSHLTVLPSSQQWGERLPSWPGIRPQCAGSWGGMSQKTDPCLGQPVVGGALLPRHWAERHWFPVPHHHSQAATASQNSTEAPPPRSWGSGHPPGFKDGKTSTGGRSTHSC
jgi:hypothetical protein